MRVLMLFWVTFLIQDANAQTGNLTATGNVTFVLPTTYTTGATIPAGAITKSQVWLKTAPILDTDTSAPTTELTGSGTSYAYTLTVPNGSTLYARVKSCVAAGCSAFSTQASRQVTILIPGMPTGVSVSVTVTVTSP